MVAVSVSVPLSLLRGVPEELKGFVFWITGGNDKQGVLLPCRVRLFLSDGHSPEGLDEAKNPFVGAVLNLVVVKQGEAEIPGLTDTILPKRVTNIRKMFNLSRKDDV
ncbi:uncharacterized protein EV420DRAFT_1486919 [Desarmillaria tabescens]|uniref:Uncharacterized protein n=1 Tax=Armillaria tabescens TaxID=1929756 RepID=A0AA39J7T3_ARMTA|nr:uncharacterized protein EV420DRAFT_1486919 [Desarmillaria tabescens]KAK0437755.1 hypothetical protein EV420DRAFT_1486919 [Desarmillaria tabescens]